MGGGPATPTDSYDDNIMAKSCESVVEVDYEPSTETESNRLLSPREFYMAWIPLNFLQEEDLRKFVQVESCDEKGDIQMKEDNISTSLMLDDLKDKASSYAFSVPISSLYSIKLHPPTLSSWHGCLTINLYGGESLVPLYFHDDENSKIPSTFFHSSHSNTNSRPCKWGGESVIQRVAQYAAVLKSAIEPSLYLINPSKADYENHSTPYYDDNLYPTNSNNSNNNNGRVGRGGNSPRRRRFNQGGSVLHQSLSSSYPPTSPSLDGTQTPLDNLSFNVFNQFSKITRTAQDIARPILSLNIAKPILPHLPSPVTNLANATRWQEEAGLDNYDSARVYLAKWARIVAEEGERSRKADFGSTYSIDDEGFLGAWEVLSTTYQMEKPRPSRASNQPIAETEWFAWMDSDGKLLLDEQECKRRIFQRGLASEARKHVWPFLLNVFPWDSTSAERKELMQNKRDEYDQLKGQWNGVKEVTSTEEFADENHRIEIDCRRTDRSHALFASNDNIKSSNDEPTSTRSSTGGHSPSNAHLRCLQHILLTYNRLDTELGYVQGMSDLCSPVYVTMEADEALTFWCFVGLMQRLSSNFMRDQSGMKEQLSRLQELISLMDPQLYKHLEKTKSLNLFFCFRWVLILFKREFEFDDILALWENFFTDCYGKDFHLFFALSILESHRDYIIRYLQDFDEVLKYINDLSMTMDPQPLLSHAEVIAKTVQELMSKIEAEKRSKQNANPDSELRQRIKHQGGEQDIGNGESSSSSATDVATESNNKTSK